MSAHSALKGSRLRRGLVTVTGLALAGAFIALGGAATAAPGPTADQVRQKINKLMSQLDRVDQQYDQSMVQLSTATTRLNMINRRLSQAQHSFEAMRLAITQIASAAYEQGDLNSTIAMLGTDNPQVVLDRADLLSHLSSDRRAQMSAFITAAKTLRDSQQQQRRTKAAIAQLEKQKAAQKAHLQHLVAKNRAELRKLTTPAPSTPSTPRTATTPVAGSGAARIAVQYALSKIGDPYVYGASGPSSFDCSGLVMAAWAAAGVSIPRTTYEQWSALPHVASSSIQPGDLLLYDAEGHVAIYVGNGNIVDAPQPGMTVEEIPMSTPWYASTFNGAVRP